MMSRVKVYRTSSNEINSETDMITLRLLGCSGGIGGTGRRTTCYGLDDTVLIDAGTGAGELSLEHMARIDHIVLTHAHLDHIACLPLLLDSVAASRETPLQIWALPAVIDILRAHVFNDQIWPDFTKIPNEIHPFVELNTLPVGVPLEIAGLRFTPLPGRHGIPACGYRVQKGQVALAFSGDTVDCPAFWEAIAGDHALAAVIIECSYPIQMAEMAALSMHLDVSTVARRLAALPDNVASIVVHRKPGMEEEIAQQLKSALPGRDLRLPVHGDVYRF
jgi:3',5'-cyclic-nucleotide phosphodiesterase